MIDIQTAYTKKNQYTKTSIFIVLISVLGILFVPSKLILIKNSLVSVSETVKSFNKSATRIPYFQFNTYERNNLYLNSGNGILSFFKEDDEILKNNLNRKISFFLTKSDFNKKNENDELFYIGLQHKNVWIDVVYYFFTFPVKMIFVFFILLVMCLNAYGFYVIKNKRFEYFLKFYLLYFILILAI